MQITRLISFISGSLAVVLNFLLISIISTKSSQRLGKYKYFLLAYALNACYFSIGQISILPTWHLPVNGFFLFSTVNIFPWWAQQIQLTCFVSSYMINVVILGWCFLYRLAVIQSAHPWLLSPLNFRLMLMFSIFLVFYMVGITGLIFPTDKTDRIFHEAMLQGAGVNLLEIGYIGAELTINDHLNINPCMTFISNIIFLTIASSMLAVCWFKIGAKLKAIRNLSCANYRFQKKLFVLLTLQTILPIVFNLSPGAIVMGLALFNIQCEDAIHICSMVLSFAQLCDPVFTVILVTDYKRAIIKLLKKAIVVIAPSTLSNVAPGGGTSGTRQSS